MRSSALVLVLVLVLSAACGDADPAPPPPEAPAEAAPPDGATDAPAAAEGPGIPLPELVDAAASASAGAVLDRLAPPRRVETEPRANRHVPAQTDTLRTYVYDGLRLTVYDVSGDADRFVQSIEVTSAAYETADGLQVGSTRADVEAALGAPDRRADGDPVYVIGGGPTPPALRVRYDGDAVTSFTYTFYVD